MYYVYILKSKKNEKHYTGYTQDLNKRVFEHNSNKNKKQFSCINGPWLLVYSEEFVLKSDAVKQEKFFKSGKGREFIKQKLKASR